MVIGLIGRKRGMMRTFNDNGDAVAVSVVEVQPNRVTQIKKESSDGYNALQVTMGKRRVSKVNKALAGHYAKANVHAGEGLWELRIDDASLLAETAGEEEGNAAIAVGSELTVDTFKNGQFVDVTGVSKGKGFAGVIKRHNFSAQNATHGNSLSHRAHGSTGQNQTPGRVFKGKKMAGQMGNECCTVQNLSIVGIDKERNLLLIRGAIPGAAAAYVMVRPAAKKELKDD